MSQKNQTQNKANKKYVRYEDLSKDDLIRMLMRLNKRLTRIQGELRDVIDILYYGAPGSGTNTSGASTSGYKGRTGSYTRGKYTGYSGYKYGRYKRKAPQPEAGEEEEPAEGEEEVEEEEEAKPVEKPVEKKPEAKEGGGS